MPHLENHPAANNVLVSDTCAISSAACIGVKEFEIGKNFSSIWLLQIA